MPRHKSIFGQYDESHDEYDSPNEEFADGPIFKKQGPKWPGISPVYLEKYRKIQSILDLGVFSHLTRSDNKYLVIKLIIPSIMLKNIKLVRIRIDDPEHWAVMRFEGFIGSEVSGEEKCDGLDSLKWALSGVFNLYHLSADTSVRRHPLHREVSHIPPVRSIPRHDGLDDMNYETREPRRALPRDGAAGGRVRRSSFTPRRA